MKIKKERTARERETRKEEKRRRAPFVTVLDNGLNFRFRDFFPLRLFFYVSGVFFASGNVFPRCEVKTEEKAAKKQHCEAKFQDKQAHGRKQRSELKRDKIRRNQSTQETKHGKHTRS